jgi:hypothetical protein
VHRHHLVEALGRQHRAVRTGELRTDQEGFDAARAEEDECGEEVEEADPLVVDGREPAEKSGALLPDQPKALCAPARERREDLDGYLSSSR